jgi:hypothetical protein
MVVFAEAEESHWALAVTQGELKAIGHRMFVQ